MTAVRCTRFCSSTKRDAFTILVSTHLSGPWSRGCARFEGFQQLVGHLEIAKPGHNADVRLIAPVIIAPASDQQTVTRCHLGVGCSLTRAVPAIDSFYAVQPQLRKFGHKLLRVFV